MLYDIQPCSSIGKIQLVSSLSQISPDAAIRDASVAAEKQYEEFSIEQTMRHDLYIVIQGLIDKTDLKTLDHEEARMLSKMERSFRRNGLHLPEDKRNEFKELRKRLSEVGIEYMKNWSNESSSKYLVLNMYAGCILFTCSSPASHQVHQGIVSDWQLDMLAYSLNHGLQEELEGMDDDFLGKCQVWIISCWFIHAWINRWSQDCRRRWRQEIHFDHEVSLWPNGVEMLADA